ncbi:hydrogenase expression/formation protein HypE [Microbulbifer donghaiensis]|uniref:Hydrogenase expression/formation protein HypE n=1 Tax=Microbulbifer donghaiensis TaxID=494016 RepID=A0A1M4UQ36_9GAMM|nr:hydrogenase expression/formation protein HypE [Microbulbifer donghaiensis]SHE58846.1 hydrogenase expression/formation protein HypE [Microbulbifer donghaiensis]
MHTECPIPVSADETVRLGHGSGGELSQRLLREYIYPHFDNAWTVQAHDSATLPRIGGRTVFTTDSFVVSPLFFPGGNIGELAVYGTVNDLAMSGARPLYLSCSLILEEGLPMKTLAAVMASMGRAAAATGVQLVTGDTKVVEKGKGDGLFINTAGIGSLEHVLSIAPDRIQPGDSILLSGDIGRHGMAVMARREGLEFDGPLLSDCAPLHEPVLALLEAGINVHCLRDLTRGGLATALVELAEGSRRQFSLRENDIAITEPVLGACEMLGLDPLYVANEGRFVAFVPPHQAQQALAILQKCPVSADSRAIGTVSASEAAEVILRNSIGCERLLDRLPGEQLPRIC